MLYTFVCSRFCSCAENTKLIYENKIICGIIITSLMAKNAKSKA